MPPKKVKGGKKGNAPSRTSEEDVASAQQFLDAQYNPDLIQSLIQELNKQVESKCSHIQSDADFMITSMQEAFHLELIKLPTQVKKMSLSRFKEEFGDSLEAVTRGAMIGGPSKVVAGGASSKSAYSSSSASSSTSHHYHGGRQSMVFQTPMGKSQPLIAQTPSAARIPREGESIVSANGSPLGCFNTVVKPKGGAVSLVPPTPGVFIPLDSGDVIDVESVNVDSLPQEMKQDALLKMQMMMSNMQKLMSKLENSNNNNAGFA